MSSEVVFWGERHERKRRSRRGRKQGTRERGVRGQWRWGDAHDAWRYGEVRGGAPRHLMPSAAAPVAMGFMMNLHLDKARSGSGTCRGI